MDFIKLPMPVEYIINKLHDNGYEAYAVGGCVRDSLMRKLPHDWDICTSALPEITKEIFRDNRIIDTGIKHGTVTVLLSDSFHKDPVPYEITTYRIDGEYADNRHPDNVEYVSDLKKDLERRDFTINAMAYNYEDGLIDPYGGKEDLYNHIIRCVGNPDDRFKEDGLRIMRAIRFVLQFNYSFEFNTELSIERNIHLLSKISKERISSELIKLIENTSFPAFLSESNKSISYNIYKLIEALSVVVPGYSTDQNVIHLFDGFSLCYRDVPFFLAVLFDNPNIEQMLKDLRFSNEIVDAAKTIREYGYRIIEEQNKWISYHESILMRYYARKLYNSIKICPATMAVNYAKFLSGNDKALNDYLTLLEMAVNRCLLNNDIYETKFLAVSGTDLITMGYKGRQIGQILNGLLDLVMSEVVKNNRKELLAAIKTIDLDGE